MPQCQHPQELPKQNFTVSISWATEGKNIMGLASQFLTTAITMNGHEVAAQLDTGGEVTTVTETWAAAHLKNLSLQKAYLKLWAVNGAEVPYAGILLVDINICGKKHPDVPVQVVKEPTKLFMHNCKRRLPVLVGMNVLCSCFPPTSEVPVPVFLQPVRSPLVSRLLPLKFGFSRIPLPMSSLGPHPAATSWPTP